MDVIYIYIIIYIYDEDMRDACIWIWKVHIKLGSGDEAKMYTCTLNVRVLCTSCVYMYVHCI